MDFDDDDDSPL